MDLSKRRVLFASHLSATRACRKGTSAVDSDSKVVDNLLHLTVQDALRTFLIDPAGYKSKEILVDKALKEELVAVLVRLGRHRVIREIVRQERDKTTYRQPDASD